jgi:hypothetical protein
MRNLMKKGILKRKECVLKQMGIFILACFICILLFTPNILAQDIPTPETVIGFKIGSDYHLADYEQSIKYFKKLAANSKLMRLIKVGYTANERPIYLSIISLPQNLKNLEHYRQIAQKIAHPAKYGLNDVKAHELAKEGKAFVDINGGLHATEVAHAQQDITLAYKLLNSKNDSKVQKILNNVVLFLWPSINPDGQDRVVHWYNKIKDTKYKNAPMHQLFEKYSGHDNDRDGFMLNLIHSRVVTHTWRHWEPQIIHTHHQPGRAVLGQRIWVPPFANPVGTHNPPLILSEINMLGMAMDQNLQSHGLTGITHMGKGYDAYYPGYLDYLPILQNIAAYWTETANNADGYANPDYYIISDFPKEQRDFRTHALYTSPWRVGWWRLSDQIEYMNVASMADLKYASKYKEQLLYNRYQSGRDVIDHYKSHAPYAYIIPQHQRDPMSAVEMLRRLAFNGIRIQQLTHQVTINGRSYPAGTWVIPMDQSFAQVVRAVLDVQHYPDIRKYPGGPLDHPYDVAGWTLPYTMDVNVITVNSPLPDDFKAAMQPVKDTPIPWKSVKDAPFLTNAVAAGIRLPEHSIADSGSALSLDPVENNIFTLVNRTLSGGGQVHFSDGHYVVSGIDKSTLEKWADSLAVHASWTNNTKGKEIHPRIGIYSSWIPNMDEGWTRWLLDKYKFNYKRIRNKEIKAGELKKKYDVIIFADSKTYRYSHSIVNGYPKDVIPAPYAGGIGKKGVKALNVFVKSGGTLITLNQSCMFAINQLDLPVKNDLKNVGYKKFFVGGSILQAISNIKSPIMTGMSKKAKIYFQNSPAFSTKPGFKGRILMRYRSEGSPLLSGFLLGKQYLYSEVAALNVKHGKGHVILFGYRPQRRGQTFGTFRMIFNAIFLGDMKFID